MVLQTQRTYLREMDWGDLDALKLILQDPEVMYAYAHAFSQEEVAAWMDKQLSRYREDGFGLWAMVLKESGQMIGQCGLSWQEAAGRQVLEIGICCKRRTGAMVTPPRGPVHARRTPLKSWALPRFIPLSGRTISPRFG